MWFVLGLVGLLAEARAPDPCCYLHCHLHVDPFSCLFWITTVSKIHDVSRLPTRPTGHVDGFPHNEFILC